MQQRSKAEAAPGADRLQLTTRLSRQLHRSQVIQPARVFRSSQVTSAAGESTAAAHRCACRACQARQARSLTAFCLLHAASLRAGGAWRARRARPAPACTALQARGAQRAPAPGVRPQEEEEEEARRGGCAVRGWGRAAAAAQTTPGMPSPQPACSHICKRALAWLASLLRGGGGAGEGESPPSSCHRCTSACCEAYGVPARVYHGAR